MDIQAREFPVASADVGLFEKDRSTFVQFAEDSEAEVDIGDEAGFQAGQTLLRLIDPEFAGDAVEDIRLEVGRSEVGIGREARPEGQGTMSSKW